MDNTQRYDTAHLGDKTPRKAWLILVVTYIASICAPVAQFKIPPMANWLFANFAPVGLDGATFGLLMSGMAIIGFILAFPAAFICRRLGLKNTVLFSLACLASGSAISALATNIPLLLVSRMIEGVGIGLIGVAAPTCVSVWFPPRRRGLALGIWATWVPFGCVFMFNIAPFMAGGDPGANLDGYKTVFWFCAILSIVSFILFAAIFTLPEGESGDIGIEGTFTASLSYLKNKYIWYLGAVFFMFCACTLSIINTYYQQFLTAGEPFGLGMSDQLAGSITSIMMFGAFIFAPVAGAVSDKMLPNSKRWVAVVSGITLLISVFFGFVVGNFAIPALVIFVIIQAVAGAFVGGGCRPMAPMIMGGTAMGAAMGMAVLQFCMNLGQAVTAPLYGSLLDVFGGNFFMPSLIIQIPMLIIGIICAALIKPFKETSIPDKVKKD